MLVRETTLTVSAAPATARQASATPSVGSARSHQRQPAQTPADTSISRPWRGLGSPVPTARRRRCRPRPIAGANRPSVSGDPPYTCAFTTGNSAAGIASTVAAGSVANAPSSTGVPAPAAARPRSPCRSGPRDALGSHRGQPGDAVHRGQERHASSTKQAATPTETVSSPAATGPASRLTWSARRDTASPAASPGRQQSRGERPVRRRSGRPAHRSRTAATTKTAARRRRRR